MRLIVSFFLLICFTGVAYAQKDTLLFKNGSIVIGKVKKIQLGVITFDPDDANDITVQLRKLESIHAGQLNFRIETVDHQLIFGKLLHSSEVGFVNVSFGTDTTLLALNNISNLYPIEKNFKERLTGTISAGYSYTRSSKLGRLNLDATTSYATEKMEYAISASAISTVDAGYFSRDNEDFGINLNYYFDPVWFAGVKLNYQRNIELGIKSRFQEGFGVGNKLLVTRHLRLLAFSGLVLNQENSTESVYSGLLTEGMAGFQLNIFRFEKPELAIETSPYFYYSFSQDRIRFDGNLSVSWEMIEDLSMKLSFYINYDSKPPGEESTNYDFGTVVSLAYEF